MQTKNRGFTILELLVVIAIIGILVTATLAMLSDSRSKAKNSAFRSEIDTLQKNLISKCNDRNLISSDIYAGSTYSAFTVDPTTQSCGTLGNATFNIIVDSTNGGSCTSATLTEEDIVYAPTGC